MDTRPAIRDSFSVNLWWCGVTIRHASDDGAGNPIRTANSLINAASGSRQLCRRQTGPELVFVGPEPFVLREHQLVPETRIAGRETLGGVDLHAKIAAGREARDQG
jgi:hypothetical protein